MASPRGTDSGRPAVAARVRPLADPEELELALGLREAVFCGEQGVRREAERDGLDGGALHLGAFEADVLVGTCRLLAAGGELVVQRVAVRADRRGRGVGRNLMDGAAAEARRLGLEELTLHAQLESEEFYRRLGYARCGRPFHEEGILHVTMRRRVPLS